MSNDFDNRLHMKLANIQTDIAAAIISLYGRGTDPESVEVRASLKASFKCIQQALRKLEERLDVVA